MKQKNIIFGLVILAVVGAAWLISNGGWFFLNILVVLVVIPIGLALCLLRVLRRRRR